MKSPGGDAFALRGEFAGFIRTDEGKRRLLLRIDGGEVPFKLPRELRRAWAGRLDLGCALAVEGFVRSDPFTGEIKRVVEHLRLVGDRPAPPDPCAKCSIRVCAKKNCWRSGGREIWHALERKIAAADLRGVVRLKASGCLDDCKRAPNLAVGSAHYRRCTPEMAARLLDHLTTRE